MIHEKDCKKYFLLLLTSKRAAESHILKSCRIALGSQPSQYIWVNWWNIFEIYLKEIFSTVLSVDNQIYHIVAFCIGETENPVDGCVVDTSECFCRLISRFEFTHIAGLDNHADGRKIAFKGLHHGNRYLLHDLRLKTSWKYLDGKYMHALSVWAFLSVYGV